MEGKTAVIYYSGTGNTEAMAEAVAVGARRVCPDVVLAPVGDVSADEIGTTSHRIILR